MTWFKKYWPSIVHTAAVAVVFLAPAVSAEIAAHKGISATVVLIWGYILHWAESPKNAA